MSRWIVLSCVSSGIHFIKSSRDPSEKTTLKCHSMKVALCRSMINKKKETKVDAIGDGRDLLQRPLDVRVIRKSQSLIDQTFTDCRLINCHFQCHRSWLAVRRSRDTETEELTATADSRIQSISTRMKNWRRVILFKNNCRGIFN